MLKKNGRVKIIFLVILLFGLLSFGAFFFSGSRKLVEGLSQNKSVVAKTWGWFELISFPVPIINLPNKDSSLMQVQLKKFGTESQVLTALVDTRTVPGLTSFNWKLGDEILIAEIPGLSLGGFLNDTISTSTYLVIDWKRR
ncbi:MAG: hypothetical protein COX02_00050 [Candidatus Vogelbacteria bacterium CG22_combo_CG10-13_8_21_14_all_37_9]|uniref:Uncharacterized protein n=1 Tax=Candidatus Vogelbacteria bacterium CG22_combo_CG10-13_8_21_14_all_37_9 TaxID=1975046 RepID=A0A2H0BLR0_9BACT|nr:MAG: hypothetical protein BK005_00045 [bacterium CG10_37_50]PIP58479.1 MAG: hypothetical protein COX02_00050 [Candidatus Vogelbacteria bacterium CG22_combo_CG10-13_8_21_14_all_37_9]